MDVTFGASLVQDFWVGPEPRLRGRRWAPFEAAPVRILFLLDRGASLEDAAVAAFLEAVGSSVDVAALEPRGEGASGGAFGPAVRDDLLGLVEAAPRRWPDGQPLLVAGHGVGGAVALSLADDPRVCGTLALAPGLPREGAEALGAVLDVPRHVAAASRPLLLVDARDDDLEDHAAIAALVASNPRAALLRVPGDRRAPLASPWAEAAAAWAAWTARVP